MDNMIFDLISSGGGGAALNFKVVGNPQPAAPSENTIWINTDEKITGWIFDTAQPETAAEGMVWILTGMASPAQFNALKKNGIMVYPLSAKQYTGGAWVDKTAKSYQGGAWVDWIAYLYDNGRFFSEFDQYIYSTGTITQNADHVLLSRTTETDSQIGWWTKDKVDLFKYKKICAEVTCADVGIVNQYGDWQFRLGAFNGRVSGNGHSTTYMVAGTTFTANSVKTVYEVDVSSVTDACYVGIQGTGIASVYKIWME